MSDCFSLIHILTIFFPPPHTLQHHNCEKEIYCEIIYVLSSYIFFQRCFTQTQKLFSFFSLFFLTSSFTSSSSSYFSFSFTFLHIQPHTGFIFIFIFLFFYFPPHNPPPPHTHTEVSLAPSLCSIFSIYQKRY